jgi:hypothetical protein
MPAIRSQQGESCHTFNKPISGKTKIVFPDEKIKNGHCRNCISARAGHAAAVQTCKPNAATCPFASGEFSRQAHTNSHWAVAKFPGTSHGNF